MFLNDSKRLILRTLRDGPLDMYQVAASTGLPPFLVRAELMGGLRRERLVTDPIGPEGHKFQLTAGGESIAWSADQMEMN